MAETSGENQTEAVGLFGREDVTGEEYDKALENLKRFSELDPTEIDNFDDLSFQMLFVSKGLRAVVATNSELRGTGGPVRSDGLTHFLKKSIEGGSIVVGEVYENDAKKIVDIEQGKEGGEPDFTISMPFGMPLATEVDEVGSRFKIYPSTYATDYRSGTAQDFHPTKDPTNVDVLRGYIRVVQAGTKSILEVAKPPTPMPSIT